MKQPVPAKQARQLAQRLLDGKLALFVGAGISHLAPARDGSGRRLPLWQELARGVAERCGEDVGSYRDLLDLFDAIVFGQDRGTLERAVRELLDDSALELSPAHLALGRLPWAAVLSTNYDGLLARALDERPVWDEEGYDRLGGAEQPRLFQVHGTLERPHTLTRGDYRGWPKRCPRAYHHLEGMLLNGTVLFVGYSLSDPHLDELLATVRRITAGREKRLHAWMWRMPAAQARLLDSRDKIEATAIGEEDEWADAFAQLAGALEELRAGGGGGGRAVAADRYAYERAQYAQALEARFGVANLQGLYVGGAGYARGDVSLEEVYVEPDLICGDRERSPEERGAVRPRRARGDEEEIPRRSAEREPASRVLSREGRLVLVGAPGQGKSTLLRQRLLDAARRWRERPDEEPFPVYLRLGDLEIAAAGGAVNLFGYATLMLPRLGEIGSDALRAWLAGRVLWLLDGVDEVRDRGARERLREEVAATAVLGHGDRWVVATRPAGEPQGGFAAGWRRAEMQPLDDRQVLRVLARWAAVLERKEGLRLDAAAMQRSLLRDRGLARLQRNALLLTLAVLFYKSRGRLPHDRWEFYEVAEQVLRDSWVHHRLHHAAEHLPGGYLPELLERLALLGMVGRKVAFTREELESECRELMAARGYGGAERDRESALFVHAAEDLIGVLVAQGPGWFGFLHLTFQEFLAARALRHRSGEVAGLLERFWDHPEWEEVWRLYALAIESDAARYAELFREVLKHPHPLDARLERHRLACLGLCGVGKAPLPREAEEVVEWATAVIRKGPTVLSDQVLAKVGQWERSPLPGSLRAALLGETRGERLRSRGVQALWVGAREAQEVRRALLARIGDGRSEGKSEAIRALAGVADEEEVWRALMQNLGDHDFETQRSAEGVLALVAGEKPVRSELLEQIHDRDQGTLARHGAVGALRGALEIMDVRRALLARLDDPAEDWRVRAAAAEALSAAVGEVEVRRGLLARLGDEHEGRSVRVAAAEALSAAAGDEEVRRALLVLLGDVEHEELWLAAVRALPASGDDPEIRRRLLELLGDEEKDPWQRHEAAAVLAGVVEDLEVRKGLLTRLEDEDRFMRSAAVEALSGAVNEEEVRLALLARLGDQDRWVRVRAAEALAGAVSDERVRRALVKCVETDGSRVRQQATRALGGAGEREDVRNLLLTILGDSDLEVGNAAFDGLSAGIVAERERELGRQENPQYSECFISFSSRDQRFADRLHADLQAAGVRCWYAPKDLPVGARTRQTLDDAIRSKDRLIVVLSRESIASDWVEKEVETAFEVERIRRGTVLLPVRIDDAVMKSTTAWASDIRNSRNIGDFVRWNDGTPAYREALERLLSALLVGR